MALALPVLLEALWLHRLNASVYTVLPPHRGPEQMETALARRELLPLGTRRIQEQSNPFASISRSDTARTSGRPWAVTVARKHTST